MSYLALARKWRPAKFEHVVGQSHVLSALENALAQNRLHHAYLFSGTRGVGKTTIGRLFAKGLNCEQGVTSTPCGVCDACKEIDQGRFVDLLEIDAASRTKVEDTRELLDNVQYKPTRGRYKVYLIDEVHMLSRHSFNALLKTLEEPPEYVKFLLATTDPQKLPVTILSRCLQFHLKPISVDTIGEQLTSILGHEGVESEPRAIHLIAHAAQGSMRDALSLTDQAIALGNGFIAAEPVAQMLGSIDGEQALRLLSAIASRDPQTIMSSVAELAVNGVEWRALLSEVAEQLHSVAMCQLLPSTLDKQRPDAEKIRLLSQAISPQEVQLYYQIALKGIEELSLSPSEQICVEMTLMRMLAFKPVQASPFEAITSPTEQNIIPVLDSQPHPASRPAPVRQAVPMPVMQQPEVPTPPPSQDTPNTADSSHQHVESDSRAAPTANTEAESTPRASSPLVGLRHQLRSKQKQVGGGDNGVKKSESGKKKPQSVLERIAQQHKPSAAHLDSLPDVPTSDIDEAYQWQPMHPEEQMLEPQLTPTELKQSLVHEKTPEMALQLAEEVAKNDTWSAIIQQFNVAKLTEQLALNAAFSRSGKQVVLNLRSGQSHLHNERTHNELQNELIRVLGDAIELSIEVGELGQTPLELREARYQEKLAHAYQQLSADPNVNFIQTRFNAELDQESVRPL